MQRNSELKRWPRKLHTVRFHEHTVREQEKPTVTEGRTALAPAGGTKGTRHARYLRRVGVRRPCIRAKRVCTRRTPTLSGTGSKTSARSLVFITPQFASVHVKGNPVLGNAVAEAGFSLVAPLGATFATSEVSAPTSLPAQVMGRSSLTVTG